MQWIWIAAENSGDLTATRHTVKSQSLFPSARSPSNCVGKIQMMVENDVISNFEFLCNSMENLISIWNFTYTVMKDVNYENFKSVEVGYPTSNR